MQEKRRLAAQVISLLNEMLHYDRSTIAKLIAYRVPCNERMCDHPTIQVNENGEVGMLGVINGIIGNIEEGPRKHWGLVTAIFDEDDTLLCFELTDENPP